MKNTSIDSTLEKILMDPDMEAIKEWFKTTTEGMEALQQANALSRLLSCSPVPRDIIQWLLDEGFDPNRLNGKDLSLPTLALFTSKLNEEEKFELLKILKAHGADINRTSPYPYDNLSPWRYPLELSVGYSLNSCSSFILEANPSQGELIDTLIYGIELQRSADSLKPILEKLEKIEIHGRTGATPLHQAVQTLDPQIVEALLTYTQNVNVPLAKSIRIAVHEASASGGGLTPTLWCPAGSTPLDLVLSIRELVATAKLPKKREKHRLKVLQAADEIHLILKKHDGQGGAFNAPYVVPFRKLIDKALFRIAEMTQGDMKTLARIAAFVDTASVGPWGYLTEIIERAGAVLIPAAGSELEVSMTYNWLGRFILGMAQPWPTLERKRLNLRKKAKLLDPKNYPSEAADAISQDNIVGGFEDQAIALLQVARNVGQVCLITPEHFEILGMDPVDFVIRQTALLLGEAEPEPKMYMERSGASANVRLMIADYENCANSNEINRLGGLPIGITTDSWPHLNGHPMHHLLTVEVNEWWLRDDIVAVSLFISDPDNHEAWEPNSDHVELIFLTEEDIEQGVITDWPEGLNGRRLASGRIITKDANNLKEANLQKLSYISGAPSFLQDEREWEIISHGPFLLQFTQDLVNINLGDSGIMYAFANTAWYQSL